MARVGIVFGLALCCLSIVGLMGTAEKTPTQFIPMMLGVPILFCGVVALNPHRRKYAMHTASLIAVLGAVCGGGQASYVLLQLANRVPINHYSFRLVVAMSVICVAFVVICVISFIQIRQRKEAGKKSDLS
jgi:hypothetical protein